MLGIALICLLTATFVIGMGVKCYTMKRLNEIDGMQGIYQRDNNKLVYDKKYTGDCNVNKNCRSERRSKR